jgi:hypothetical protein
MEHFSALIPISLKLHQTFVSIFYLMLPVAFALALVMDWMRNPGGSPDFLNTLKRAVISTLLVTAFPEISELILSITSGIAVRVSDLSGLDSMIQMAAQKTKNYSMSPFSMVLGFNDLMLAVISFVSYLVLYFAQFITVAIFHFVWTLLYILSPLLILFHLFPGTSNITQNLFRSMMEVASYKIIWAVLSMMITHLPLGNAYAAEGNYLTVILLNFVIAIAMLSTPLIVKSLIGAGLTSASETLQRGTLLPMGSVQVRPVMDLGRKALTYTWGQTGNIWNSMHTQRPHPYPTGGSHGRGPNHQLLQTNLLPKAQAPQK